MKCNSCESEATWYFAPQDNGSALVGPIEKPGQIISCDDPKLLVGFCEDHGIPVTYTAHIQPGAKFRRLSKEESWT